MLIEQPAMRLVARMLLPSTSIPMIAARFAVLSRFILNIMPERLRIVNPRWPERFWPSDDDSWL